MRENRSAKRQPSLPPGAGGTTLAPPPSDNERAGDLFAEEVGRLPGVLRVERWGQERSDARGGSAAPTFHIYVRPNDREAEYAVYELQGQVYDRFPEASLEGAVLDPIAPLCPDDDPRA